MPQIENLPKGLAPTPGSPDKSTIWSGFKDFCRSLVLKPLFSMTTDYFTQDQKLVQFLSENVDDKHNPFKTIHSPFRNKGTSKPVNTQISPNVFKQAFKRKSNKIPPITS